MRSCDTRGAAILMFSLLTIAPALAQAKKTPPAPAGQPYVLGTRQLPGDFGRIGQEYTIGVSDPLNFTLKSASYIVDRVYLDTIADGKTTWFPGAGKKYLRLDLTIRNSNPKQQDLEVRPGGLQFTVVDANNENHVAPAVYSVKTGKEINLVLKPGQSLEVFTIIELPAEGDAPKLIVQREERAAVVRYDLRDKVKPLPAWAGEGANAKDTITGVRECIHPMQHFDVGVRGLEWTRTALDGDPAGDGERLLVAHLTFRATTGGIPLNYGTFMTIVKTDDGQEIVREAPGGIGGFLFENRSDAYSGSPDKGETLSLRVHFRLKEGASPKTLTIKDDQGSGRSIKFDLSDQDWFTLRDCVRDLRTGQPLAHP